MNRFAYNNDFQRPSFADRPWRFENMHGRSVILREETGEICADCNAPSKLEVEEAWKAKRGPRDNPKYWYWCGVCDIGG